MRRSYVGLCAMESNRCFPPFSCGQSGRRSSLSILRTLIDGWATMGWRGWRAALPCPAFAKGRPQGRPGHDGLGRAGTQVAAIQPSRWFSALILLLVLATPALAVQPDEVMKDPALEARARTLSSELRCMVCQNQSIDDSDAPLARDIRLLIRQRIAGGESNAAVRSYLVSRYGDFILLKPPFKLDTALLWLAAPLTLVAGAAAIFLSRRRAPAATDALTDEEEARLAALMKGKGG